jgi:hypothetical protein
LLLGCDGNPNLDQEFVGVSGRFICAEEELFSGDASFTTAALENQHGIRRQGDGRHFRGWVRMTEIPAQGAAVAYGAVSYMLIGLCHKRTCCSHESGGTQGRVPGQSTNNEVAPFDSMVIKLRQTIDID